MQSKTAVCIPYAGAMDHEHLECRQLLEARGYRAVTVRDNNVIDQARSFLASFVLQRYPEVHCLLWIDSDVLFSADDAESLIEQCLSLEHPFLGAGYAAKRPKGTVVGAIEAHEVTWFEGGAVHPAFNVGFGFTAVHRDVFEAVGRSLPDLKIATMNGYVGKPYFSPLWRDGVYYPEDVSFCRRAEDAGYKCHVDTRIRIAHKGAYHYGIEDTALALERYSSLRMRLAHKTTKESSDENPPRPAR